MAESEEKPEEAAEEVTGYHDASPEKNEGEEDHRRNEELVKMDEKAAIQDERESHEPEDAAKPQERKHKESTVLAQKLTRDISEGEEGHRKNEELGKMDKKAAIQDKRESHELEDAAKPQERKHKESTVLAQKLTRNTLKGEEGNRKNEELGKMDEKAAIQDKRKSHDREDAPKRQEQKHKDSTVLAQKPTRNVSEGEDHQKDEQLGKTEEKAAIKDKRKSHELEDVTRPQEEKRKDSTGKRTSIDSKVKSAVPETFVSPNNSKGQRMSTSSPDRRGSFGGGFRRSSTLEKFPRKSMSAVRKSRFGALSSKARMVLGSILDIKATTGETYDRKSTRYQNTYKLDSDNPFNPEKVDKILREVMQQTVENLHYDPEKCAIAAKFASTQIRSKVKQLEFDRYKLICIVSIGEKNSQDVYATCRFLWDPEKDRFAFYSMENSHVYAIAYCFGLYYE